MKDYMEDYESGLWNPPTSDVIKGWLKEYDISIKELGNFLGLKGSDTRSFTYSEDKKFRRIMNYSQTRRFLVWVGLIEPERRGRGVAYESLDFFEKLKVYFRKNDLTLKSFCNDDLGFSPTNFHLRKNENPDKLEELIRSKIEIE